MPAKIKKYLPQNSCGRRALLLGPDVQVIVNHTGFLVFDIDVVA